jgi:hypothetical protein
VTVQNSFNADLAIDTDTGGVTSLSVPAYNGPMSRAVISADNQRVYFNNCGAVFVVDTASGDFKQSAAGPGTCYGDYDLTVSSNQKRAEATGYLFDPNLDSEAYITLNYRETQDTMYVYGTKLSPDGTLLFQPSTNGVDVFDGRLGTLRARIALPFALSQNYDAMVGDGKDNVFLAITGTTGNGIAVIDLNSIAEPAPLSYLDDAAFRSRAAASSASCTTDYVRPNARIEGSTQTFMPGAAIRHVANRSIMQR